VVFSIQKATFAGFLSAESKVWTKFLMMGGVGFPVFKFFRISEKQRSL